MTKDMSSNITWHSIIHISLYSLLCAGVWRVCFNKSRWLLHLMGFNTECISMLVYVLRFENSQRNLYLKSSLISRAYWYWIWQSCHVSHVGAYIRKWHCICHPTWYCTWQETLYLVLGRCLYVALLTLVMIV